MTPIEVKQLRRELGKAVLEIQNRFKDHPVEEVLTEIIAALTSLAGNISKNNAKLSGDQFMLVCSLARQEEWPT